MEKYINRVLGIARTVGTIKTMDIGEANKWHPKHIGIAGVTADGEKFSLALEIGAPAKEEEETNAETVL